jgi:hypothetical protein
MATLPAEGIAAITDVVGKDVGVNSAWRAERRLMA